MQASEVTPLLGGQKISSPNAISIRASTETAVHGKKQQLQHQHQHQHQCREEDKTCQHNDDVVPPTVSRRLQTEPDASPPGCGTALFLVLLCTLFISNIEGSLLLTTHAQVASDFGQYRQSQWLIVAYPLAVSAAEPVVGALSNGIGRKRVLLISYIIFATAATVCGAAPHFAVFILGRVLAGVGGSGMMGMVNLIVSDLVGLQDLATYRSYFQAAMASGRLLGGPVGGLLVERWGWRLLFIVQTPILLLAALACAILIPSLSPATSLSPHTGHAVPDAVTRATQPPRHQIWTTLRHVDFAGAGLLVCTITLGLLSIVFLGDGSTIRDYRVCLTLSLCLVCGGLLVTVERYVVSQPMLSRRILSNPIVVAIYLINIFGMTAQSSLSFVLPLDDQILNDATADRAGLQLLPLVVGSIGGSIAAGLLIKRGYNLITLFSTATTIASLARAVMYLWWYSVGPLWHIVPLVVIGLSSSVTFATTYIFLNAQVTRADQAMAVACLFCLYGIGSALGTTASKVLMNLILRARLIDRLDRHDPNTPKIIASLMDDHRYIRKLPHTLQLIIQQSVKDSFSASRAFSLASQLATLPCLMLLQKHGLPRPRKVAA